MKTEVIAMPALEDRSIKDLRSLLAELKKNEKRMAKIVDPHPEITILPNDDGLKETEYKIWQMNIALSGTRYRIKNIEKVIEQKKKPKKPSRKKIR